MYVVKAQICRKKLNTPSLEKKVWIYCFFYYWISWTDVELISPVTYIDIIHLYVCVYVFHRILWVGTEAKARSSAIFGLLLKGSNGRLVLSQDRIQRMLILPSDVFVGRSCCSKSNKHLCNLHEGDCQRFTEYIAHHRMPCINCCSFLKNWNWMSANSRTWMVYSLTVLRARTELKMVILNQPSQR